MLLSPLIWIPFALADIAGFAQQLNIADVVRATTREGLDVIRVELSWSGYFSYFFLACSDAYGGELFQPL